jgi:hypothetical protein
VVWVRLDDFERSSDGEFSRFLTRVPDVAGVEEFELRIAGPGKLVEEMLAEATIDLTIDSSRDELEPESQIRREFDSAHEEQRRAMWELAALDDIDQLLKPTPPPPERDSSVFAAIRPVSSGGGTTYVLDVLNVTIPARSSLFTGGWWVNRADAFVAPSSGDQDLFLHSFGPNGPVLAASRRGGTALDLVGPVRLTFPWVAWFRVFGFTAGTMNHGWFWGGLGPKFALPF